ncbi:MAG TPA: hypothetical protein VF624_00785 [Tepidisphaeraceae bacterium]|jgi:hypothetical protein
MLKAKLNASRWIGAEYEMTVPLVGTGGGHDARRRLGGRRCRPLEGLLAVVVVDAQPPALAGGVVRGEAVRLIFAGASHRSTFHRGRLPVGFHSATSSRFLSRFSGVVVPVSRVSADVTNEKGLNFLRKSRPSQ